MNNITVEEREQAEKEKKKNEEDDTNTGEKMLMEQLNNLKTELRKLKKDLQTTRLKNDHIKRKITRLADRQTVRKNNYVRSRNLYGNLYKQILTTAGHLKQELWDNAMIVPTRPTTKIRKTQATLQDMITKLRKIGFDLFILGIEDKEKMARTLKLINTPRNKKIQ